MLFGLLMRAGQAGIMPLDAALFYQLMTAHGIGMVGASGFAGAAIMWYFMRQYVPVTNAIFWGVTVLFLIGVVMILSAIFLMGFVSAWTFLYPLPAQSGGVWDANAAVVYLVGLLLIGVAFLVFYLDVGWATIKAYGGLGRAMGWPQLFGAGGDAPPPAVVAGTVVTVVNTIALVPGAAIILISIVNVLIPSFGIDALLAKNMIFFFGHVFINAAIYMAIIAVYEIVPRYTGRPWKSNRIFLAAWFATLFMVMAVYPHHLFQDIVMPGWMMVMGQVFSYLSGFPILLVTTIGLLSNLYGAKVKWDLPLALLTLGVFGWAAGVVPAILDGIISVNNVMHNTMWVPGHFHFYLLLGLVAMAFGFMLWLTRSRQGSGLSGFANVLLWLYVVGGLGVVGTFLYAGSASVPRRWAVHMPQWQGVDLIATLFSILAVLGALYFLIRYIVGFGGQPTSTEAAE
jgi:cytochrome c oxidase subunit 1